RPGDGRVRRRPRLGRLGELPLLLAVPEERERVERLVDGAPAAVGSVRPGAGRLPPVPARAAPLGPARRGVGGGPGRPGEPEGGGGDRGGRRRGVRRARRCGGVVRRGRRLLLGGARRDRRRNLGAGGPRPGRRIAPRARLGGRGGRRRRLVVEPEALTAGRPARARRRELGLGPGRLGELVGVIGTEPGSGSARATVWAAPGTPAGRRSG